MDAVADRRSDEVVILLLPDKKELYPLSTHALRFAQSSKKRLEIEYKNAFIVDRDGHLYRINGFNFIGPAGDTFLQRTLSKFLGLWNIKVSLLGPLDVSHDELVNMVIYCIDFYAQDKFDSLDIEERNSTNINDIKSKFISLIQSTHDKKDLVDQLELPVASDCLDLL
jgi:hypothetical protein